MPVVDKDGHSLACFECGKPAEHAHHVVPRSRGGTKTVPLCHDCHDLVHFRTDDAGSLLRSAYLQARAAMQVADQLPREVQEEQDEELEIEVNDTDVWQASQPGVTDPPEFFARIRAKVRARR